MAAVDHSVPPLRDRPGVLTIASRRPRGRRDVDEGRSEEEVDEGGGGGGGVILPLDGGVAGSQPTGAASAVGGEMAAMGECLFIYLLNPRTRVDWGVGGHGH